MYFSWWMKWYFCLLGMTFGLFLSAICKTEDAAVQTAIAVFYPNMLLSGEFNIHTHTLQHVAEW